MKIKIIGPADPALEVTQAVIAERADLNSEIRIIPWAEYRDALMETLEAETAPNQLTFVPGHVWIPELAEGGYLAGLDMLVVKLPENAWQAYQPSAIMGKVAAEALYHGRQYMIPTFNDGQLLFYRSDLFDLDDSAGPPEVSPFELEELAAQEHNPPDLFGIALKAHPSEILFDWMPFLLAAGGEMMDSAGQPALANLAGVRALKAYCRLREYAPPDTHEYGNEEIAQVLKTGKAALVTTWGGQAAPIFLDQNNPYRGHYKAGVFPHPCGATWGMAIPANQPEEKKVKALEIALALNGPEQDLEVTVKAGSPVRESSYTEEAYAEYSWLRAQHKMLMRFALIPQRPEAGKYLGAMTEAVYQAFTGSLSPEEALNEAEEKIKALLSS